MLIPLILGSSLIVVNMGIQCITVVFMIRYLINTGFMEREGATLFSDIKVMSLVLLVLLVGHFFQFLTWALVFVTIGEFPDLNTAFYHSIVNFSSLGYGDIVMSAEWRILGPLEACNGVLMFGLSAGAVLAIMAQLFKRYETGR